MALNKIGVSVSLIHFRFNANDILFNVARMAPGDTGYLNPKGGITRCILEWGGIVHSTGDLFIYPPPYKFAEKSVVKEPGIIVACSRCSMEDIFSRKDGALPALRLAMTHLPAELRKKLKQTKQIRRTENEQDTLHIREASNHGSEHSSCVHA